MPLWFGSKSSAKDARKKNSFENIFDGAKRRLKHFKEENSSPRSALRGLESASDSGSGAWQGSKSPSPTIIACPKSLNEDCQAQPHPLPCAPPTSGRATSGIRRKGGHMVNFPSLPLPSPEQIMNTVESLEGEGDILGFASDSTSSVSSQGSMDAADMWPNIGPSILLSPHTKSSCRSFPENYQQNGFGQELFGQGSPIPNLHMRSPQRTLHGNWKDAHISQRSNGTSDSPSMSPRRVLGTDPLYGDDFTMSKSAFDNSAVGVSPRSSPAFGFNASGNVTSSGDAMRHMLIQQGRLSPELSPIPSPKKRSPGPSPRIQSVAVSPLHPQAVVLGQETGLYENGNLEGHPLPLPPNSPLVRTQVLVTPNPSVPRSPGRTDKPANLATGWAKGSFLGSGTFGQVYTGFHSETGLMCAIKEVLLVPDDEKSMESAKQLAQEISLLSQMQHPNVVQYYGSETIEDKLYIYIEYMSGGSIHKLLQQYGAMPESCIRGYARQILSGLAYLHSKNTVHRDIKGANILVDKGGVVKLADFGMAKHISAKSFPLSFKGSPYWMAPEVIRNRNGYDVAVDIWSLGCTVLEMATGKPPWSQFEGVAAMFKIGSTKDIPDIPEFLSDDGKCFIRSCLCRNARDRPTATQLLEHPFISTIPHHVCRPEDQLTASNGVATDMQALSINESRSQSRNVSRAGNKSATLSPSSSPKLRSTRPNYGTLSPSAASTPILKSGCPSPLRNGRGSVPLSVNGMLKASSVYEAYDKSLKSPISQVGITASTAGMHFDYRSDYQHAAIPQWQNPDGSPRRHDFALREDEYFTTASGRLPREGEGESQRYHGGRVLSSEHFPQQLLRSPKRHPPMQFQPGSPALPCHTNLA